jgi:ABC-2 type transport system ATP-binding protein
MSLIECSSLTKKFGDVTAVDELTLSLHPHKITGLIGRNGAGKTTLFKLLAGYLRPTSGRVTVFTENPFNNLNVSAGLIFIDDQLPLPVTMNLAETLFWAGTFYPEWDGELARGLLDYFRLDPRKYYQNLSKGMRSTFTMILGIAARCPLTIFDEPTTGMDAAVRKDFYRALLKDFMQHPRTIILSSHLLNEIDEILDDVLLIKDGRKYLHLPVDELREYAVGLQGRAETVTQLIGSREVFHRRQLGKNLLYAAVRNDFSRDALEEARIAGVDVSAVGTNELCIYLTADHKGGIDDVFDRT